MNKRKIIKLTSKKNRSQFQDEMIDEELDQVRGGLNTNSIHLCVICEQKIAVFGMTTCAPCFREQNKM